MSSFISYFSFPSSQLSFLLFLSSFHSYTSFSYFTLNDIIQYLNIHYFVSFFLFFPLFPLSFAIGDDCRLDSLVIANKHVWIRANSIISPVTPFQVTQVKSKALYRYVRTYMPYVCVTFFIYLFIYLFIY